MTRPANEVLNDFRSNAPENFGQAADNLLTEVYSDESNQFDAERQTYLQTITDDLVNSGYLPELSVAWVQKNSSLIDADGDGFITTHEVSQYADGLDGSLDGEINDPLANALAESFLAQYDEIVALCEDGDTGVSYITQPGQQTSDLEARMYQIRFAQSLSSESVFNSFDTAAGYGDADGLIGWHDVNDVLTDARNGNPEEQARALAILEEAGLTVNDLQYVVDHWNDPSMSILRQGDLISRESLSGGETYMADSWGVERDNNGAATEIHLPGSSASWQRYDNDWTYVDPTTGVEYEHYDVVGEPEVNMADNTVTFRHSDGSTTVYQYSPAGQVEQITQVREVDGQTQYVFVSMDENGTISNITISSDDQPSDGDISISLDGDTYYTRGGALAEAPSWVGQDGVRFGNTYMSDRFDLEVLIPVMRGDEEFLQIIQPDGTYVIGSVIENNLIEEGLPDGSAVEYVDGQVVSVRFPDGTSLIRTEAEEWTYTAEGGMTIVVPQPTVENGILVFSGNPSLPALNENGSVNIPADNGVINTYHDGELVRITYGQGPVVTFDMQNNAQTVVAGGREYVWNSSSNSWTVGGFPVDVTINFNSDSVVIQENDGTSGTYMSNGERIVNEQGTISRYHANESVPYAIECANGQAWIRQGDGDSPTWMLVTGESGEEVALSEPPAVNSDGSITVSLGDGSTATYRFDAATGALDTVTYEQPDGSCTFVDYNSEGQVTSVVISNDDVVSADDYSMTRNADGIFETSSGAFVTEISISATGQMTACGELVQRNADGTISIFVLFNTGADHQELCREQVFANGTTEIRSLNGDQPIVRTRDGVTIHWEGNQMDSLTLPGGLTMERRDDGSWIMNPGEIPVAAPNLVDGILQVPVGDSSLTLIGQSPDGSPSVNVLNLSSNVLETYDGDGELVGQRFANHSVIVTYHNGQVQSARIEVGGSVWTFDGTNWLLDGQPTTSLPPQLQHDESGNLTAVTIPEGNTATTLTPDLSVTEAGTDGSSRRTTADGFVIETSNHISTTYDPEGRVVRIESSFGTWYREDGRWFYQGAAGERVELANVSGTPRINSDGTAVISLNDGTTATYSYSEAGALEGIMTHRMVGGQDQYVFIQLSASGEVTSVTVSRDATVSDDDFRMSRDGDSFYSVGGAVQGEVTFVNGQVLIDGVPLLNADNASFTLRTIHANELCVEQHLADGSFTVSIQSSNELVMQGMADGTFVRYEDGQMTSISLPNGSSLVHSETGWIYTPLQGEPVQVAAPLIDGNRIYFQLGTTQVNLINIADGSIAMVDSRGFVHSFNAAGEALSMSYESGRVTLVSDNQIIIDNIAYTFNPSAAPPRWEVNGQPANLDIEIDGDSVTIARGDGSGLIIFSDGTEFSYTTSPTGIITTVNADGAVVRVETSSGAAWALIDGNWTYMDPSTGATTILAEVSAPPVVNADGTITVTFQNRSETYHVNEAGWMEGTVTADLSGNVLRVQSADETVWLNVDGVWQYHDSTGTVHVLPNVTSAPQINADGSVTVTYSDGSTATYQYDAQHDLSTVTYHQAGDSDYTIVEYGPDGRIVAVVVSSDISASSEDVRLTVNSDGALFAPGGQVIGTVAFTPEGRLLVGSNSVDIDVDADLSITITSSDGTVIFSSQPIETASSDSETIETEDQQADIPAENPEVRAAGNDIAMSLAVEGDWSIIQLRRDIQNRETNTIRSQEELIALRDSYPEGTEARRILDLMIANYETVVAPNPNIDAFYARFFSSGDSAVTVHVFQPDESSWSVASQSLADQGVANPTDDQIRAEIARIEELNQELFGAGWSWMNVATEQPIVLSRSQAAAGSGGEQDPSQTGNGGQQDPAISSGNPGQSDPQADPVQSSTVTRDDGGNVIRVDSPDGSSWMRQADGTWTYNGQIVQGMSQPPIVNADGSISVVLNDGRWLVYQYDDTGASLGVREVSPATIAQGLDGRSMAMVIYAIRSHDGTIRSREEIIAIRDSLPDGHRGIAGLEQLIANYDVLFAPEAPWGTSLDSFLSTNLDTNPAEGASSVHVVQEGDTVYDIVEQWLIDHDLPHTYADVIARANMVMVHNGYASDGSNWTSVAEGQPLIIEWPEGAPPVESIAEAA